MAYIPNRNQNSDRDDEKYNIFLKHIEDEPQDASGFTKVFLVLVSILLALMLVFIFALNDKKSIEKFFGEDSFVSNTLIQLQTSKQKRIRHDFRLPFFNRSQNVLLLGVDSNGDDTDIWRSTRSDTILIFNIHPKKKSINIISVPRDSKVYIAENHGLQKINAAHSIGGIKLSKKTIEQALGIKIDKYVVVNNDIVAKLVDAIGGVPVYVEKNMYYNDRAGKLHVNLKKGLNVLSGEEAVGYLRYRKDGLGDIGRTQRQQWFLRSLLKEIQTPQVIAKVPELMNIIAANVKTDLSLYEISQFASLAKSLDLSKIEVATLPGSPNKKGQISYWILDPQKTQQMIDRLIYRDKVKSDYNDFSAGIMYSSEFEDEAMLIKEELASLGIETKCFERQILPHSQFVAHSNSVSGDFFDWLKKKVPELKDNQFVFNPTRMYCGGVDFTVIVSGS